ncbi:MAG: tetratricopeptide repeat protein [Anaerolineae bacterium]|nr:tetratricopeptide repeat protein [Anaerolineae bacterium]
MAQYTGRSQAEDDSYWMPPQLKTPFGRYREQEQLLDAYQQVQESGRSQIILLVGKPSSGRHALVDWLADQDHVAENGVAWVDLAGNPRIFGSILRSEARRLAPYPLLFIVENLERGEHWLDDLLILAQEMAHGKEKLPILLIITLTTYMPMAELTGKLHTETTRFAQKLQRSRLATLIKLGPISEDDILHSIAPADPRLAQRLYELAEGSPYWSEIIWEEWIDAHELGVEQDKNGVWQAIRDDVGNLTIYANVAQEVCHQLERLLQEREDSKSPYSRKQVEEILQCAATEGEIFTVEAVAAVLSLDKDELLTFFEEFLELDEDENSPQPNVSGLIEWNGEVQIDPNSSKQEDYTGRIVTEYAFASPYLYYAWCKHPPLILKRGEWKALLAMELERLYWPYGEKIVEKLALLAPRLAEPYRQRQQKRVSLQQLRYQVHMLLGEKKEDQYAAYRLFDVGEKLLGVLADNASHAEEGIRLAQTLYERALFWQDVGVEASIAHYWAWHLHNTGNFAEALPLCQRAVDLCEIEDLDHLLYAASLNTLGALLQAMGNLSEARPFFERALSIYEKALGPDHPDTATSLNNLGYLLQDMGNLSEARPFFERALAILEQALGADHSSTTVVRNNLRILESKM